MFLHSALSHHRKETRALLAKDEKAQIFSVFDYVVNVERAHDR